MSRDLSKLDSVLGEIRALVEMGDPIYSGLSGRVDSGQDALKLDTVKVVEGFERWIEQTNRIVTTLTKTLQRAAHVGDAGGFREARKELSSLTSIINDYDKQLADLERRATELNR